MDPQVNRNASNTGNSGSTDFAFISGNTGISGIVRNKGKSGTASATCL